MVKYRLPESITIIDSGEYINGTIAIPESVKGHFIVFDRDNDRGYVVNETVKYFIEKFSTPRTKQEVVKEVALDVCADIKVIDRRCTSFLRYLNKRKILISDQEVDNRRIKTTVFNEGDWINDMHVVEVVASKHNTDLYHVLDNGGNHYIVKLLNPIKVPDHALYREELSDLEHEYQMLYNIRDASSVSCVYDFNKEFERGAYIVMEYIDGKPLSYYLKQSEGLSWEVSKQIIINILEAFAFLHENKLVHGDIHPANIMVCEDQHVRIIDLGLSSGLQVASDEIQRIGGVTYYMPPERINVSSKEKFSKEANFYSDVYQIGLLLYYILYKNEPFQGFTWEELAKNIKEQKISYPPYSYFQFPVPDSLIKVIECCTQKRPRNRYANAACIYEDFKKKVFQ